MKNRMVRILKSALRCYEWATIFFAVLGLALIIDSLIFNRWLVADNFFNWIQELKSGLAICLFAGALAFCAWLLGSITISGGDDGGGGGKEGMEKPQLCLHHPCNDSKNHQNNDELRPAA